VDVAAGVGIDDGSGVAVGVGVVEGVTDRLGQAENASNPTASRPRIRNIAYRLITLLSYMEIQAQ